MKILVAATFIAAACCAVLSYAQILSPTSLVPAMLFASVLILTLLHMINVGDRRY